MSALETTASNASNALSAWRRPVTRPFSTSILSTGSAVISFAAEVFEEPR